MSATNQTPNYDLPQYIGTDVPSYLGDFNKAMLDIDTAIKGVDNKAASAVSSVATANANASEALENANTASAKADTAQATATQAQTTATQAQATATQANSTANTAKSTANTAKSTADNAQEVANKTNTDISDWKTHDLSAHGLTLHLAFNKKLNLFGIWGTLEGGSFPGGYQDMGVLPDSFLPKTAVTRKINNAAFIQATDSSTNAAQVLIRNTDNMVRISTPGSKTWNYMYFQAMLQTSQWWE